MVLGVVLAAGTGCSRAKNIPPKELKEIFKDAFLVNAYYQSNPQLMFSMTADSLDIYRPILKRHGYRLRDLEYTIQQISKQKSRNLSDIVELSIAELKKETESLDQRVAVLDSVDARAMRRFARTVLFEERIEAREVRDTAKLRITIPVETGTYELSYSYLVDSLDQNHGLRVTGMMYDTLGHRRSILSQPLTKKQRQTAAPQRFDAADSDSLIVLYLGNYSTALKQPHLTIDSLKLVHFPPAKVAVDSLMKIIFPINIPPFYGTQKDTAQDSGALRTDTQRVDSLAVGNARP